MEEGSLSVRLPSCLEPEPFFSFAVCLFKVPGPYSVSHPLFISPDPYSY